MKPILENRRQIGLRPWADINACFYNRLATRTLSYLSVRQIHSSVVIDADQMNDVKSEGDALVSSTKTALGVHTADCLPLLAFDEQVFGACHAGWRGLTHGIVENWVSALIKKGARLNELKVALGPCIQQCHFEVGLEVVELFEPECIFSHADPQKRFVSLPQSAVRKMSNLGLKLGNISLSSDCTYCNPELYFSYRRDGPKKDRMISVIGGNF